MSRLEFDNMVNLHIVRNKKTKEIIGKVYYFHAWGRYVFETSREFIHSYGCLEEIVDFMKSLGGKP